MADMPIISCDSHISEPEDLWSSRLPQDQVYRAPIYGRLTDTSKIFRANGKIVSVTDEYRRFYRGDELTVVTPRHVPDDVRAEPIERDDLDGRLRDMEADGVHAETLHPNVALFVYDIEDPEFSMTCARIYNDYAIERYDSDRLLPNAVIPVRDIALAVAEIERAAGLGYRGIELPLSAPAGKPYYLSEYEPVWAAARAHGFPIAMHAGSGGGINFVNDAVPWPSDGTDLDRAATAMKTATGGFQGWPGQCGVTLPELIGAGVCERYPELHFVLVETGARWLALLMQNMDAAWTGLTVDREVQRTFFRQDGSPVPQYPEEYLDRKWQYPLLPSEYVKRQIHVGFMEDPIALEYRSITGVEPLVWGNDYPHYEGTWPNSRTVIEEQAARAGLTDDEKRKIFGGTIAEVYGIDLSAAA